MQLYFGTYLKKDEKGNYIVDIPENIITTSDFKKYRTVNTYLYVPKNLGSDYFTDEIQACVTPLSKDKFENLYFIELKMPNKSGAFLTFLELFKREDVNINIEECRAIDSVNENQGRVELITTVGKNLDGDDKTKVLENFLNKEYLKLLGINNDSEDNEFIKVKKPFDENFFDKFKSINNDLDDSFDIINDMYGKTFPIVLPNKILESIIGNRQPFLGITYFSEGNFILIKFKSLKEVIVPLEVIFTSNESGLLKKIIEPLADIGVNLRLILPNNLNGHKVYHIYFNIENTKLTVFDGETILHIIKAHINVQDLKNIKISILKNLHDNKYGGRNLKTDFKTFSSYYFFVDILPFIKFWEKKLQPCKENCTLQTCKLAKDWSNTKIELHNLIEKINNLKIKSINIMIPENLVNIKSSFEDKCIFKHELQQLHKTLENINLNEIKIKAEFGDQAVKLS